MSECTLLHVHSRAMGYGRAGVDLVRGLRDQGVTVFDDQGPPPGDIRLSSDDSKVAYGHMRPPEPTKVICWVSVPTHARWWYEGQHATILSMWEASVLPEAFRDTLDAFDLVLVPSLHNVELFGKFHPNVQFLPLGVDPAQWHFVPRKPVTSDFRFLIAGSGPRKGTDVAYDAFKTVFGHWFKNGDYTGPEPRPWLVMKNPKNEDFYAPWVEMHAGRLEDDEETALYESCHAYVQPSRGEGFGLQPLQAMAQGMPTILTDAHGHESFAHLGIPIGYGWSEADYFIYGDAGKWWEPDVDEVCEAMFDVYSHYDTHKTSAIESAYAVAKHWTVDNMATKFRDLHGGLLDERGPGKDSPIIEPEHKLYLCRVLHAQKSEMVDGIHIFEPGKDYYETAEIKRLLFEAGNLDPSCVQHSAYGEAAGMIETGLSARQLGRLEEYSSAHSYCPTCLQKLNSGVTRADEIMAEMAS